MKVSQLYNNRGRAVANQFIIEGEGKTQLQSYSSLVVSIDGSRNITLGPDWDYSRTTMRAVSQFLRDNGFEGGTAKDIRKALKVGQYQPWGQSTMTAGIRLVATEKEM